MQEYVRPIIILFLICFIAAGLLAYTFSFTDPIIKENLEKARDEALKQVKPDIEKFEMKKKDEFSYYVGQNIEGDTGYALEVETKGYQGPITLIIGMNTDGSISGVKILQQSETPGLGAHIADDWFQDQFAGKSYKDDFMVKGESKDLDAITGATISSDLVASSVKDNTRKLFEKVEE